MAGISYHRVIHVLLISKKQLGVEIGLVNLAVMTNREFGAVHGRGFGSKTSVIIWSLC